MQVSYQHVDPHDGRESYLVRFYDEIRDQTTCVLGDAGDEVTLLRLADAPVGEELAHGQTVDIVVQSDLDIDTQEGPDVGSGEVTETD